MKLTTVLKSICVILILVSLIGISSAADGDLKWSYTTGNQIYSSPAIAEDGTIFIASSDLYAINTGGSLNWSYPLSYSEGGIIINEDEEIFIGSYLNKLHGFNSDGSVLWNYSVGSGLESTPAIDKNGNLYFGSDDSKFYSVDSNGNLRWSHTTGDIIQTSPAISQSEIVYVGSKDGILYAFDLNGNDEWTYNATSAIYSSPTIASDGTIYFGCNNFNLIALNPDGSLKWTYNTGSNPYGTSAIASDGTVYIEGVDSGFYGLIALNPDGSKKWFYQFGSGAAGTEASPVITEDGRIFIGCANSVFYAINPDGTLYWSYTVGNEIPSSPAIAQDGTIYVGSTDNDLYAFEGSSPPLYSQRDYFDGDVASYFTMRRNQMSSAPTPTATPTATVTPVVAPPPISTSVPTPAIPIPPQEKITIIEELMTFLLTPLSWIFILFSYLGALIGKSSKGEENSSTSELIADIALYGTIGWILILLINFFISLITISEMLSIIIFFISGFVVAMVLSRTEQTGFKSGK